MRTSDFTTKPNSKSLNETLSQKFGEKLDIKNYTNEQLAKAAALIESKLAAYSKSKFNDTLKNEEFHRLKMMHDVVKTAISERAVSKSQQQAAGAALAAKRGDAPKSKLKGSSKEMMKMSTKELEKFAGTKHKGLPKKKTKVDEGLLGGLAGAGLGYMATGNPLGALAGGYLGSKVDESQLDEVSELAWENARNYVRSMKRGMLEQSKHYKEACRNWGGKIWHDDMGECWMSHASINEGQPFKVHGIGEMNPNDGLAQPGMVDKAISGLGSAASDLGTFASQNPGAAALGAGAAGLAGLAAGKLLGRKKEKEIDDSFDPMSMLNTAKDAIVGAGQSVGQAVGGALAPAATPGMGFGPGSPGAVAADMVKTGGEIGAKAALPVAAGAAGLAAGSMLGGDDDKNEGIVSGAKKVYNVGKKALGGTVGALGGHQVGKFVGGLAGSPELGGLAGAGLGALAGVDYAGDDEQNEDVLAKKDYDRDGKIEKSSDEWKGSRDKAIKKAMAMRENIHRMLREGEEGKAEIIMAVKNMVDKFTGWSEDIAQMQAQTAMEMADSIRDEMGSDMAEQFAAAVQPALDSAFEAVKSARETLSTTVGSLTGEGPAPMGAPAPDMAAGSEAPLPDLPDEEEPAEVPVPDETPPEGRAKRESIERTLRVSKILAGR